MSKAFGDKQGLHYICVAVQNVAKFQEVVTIPEESLKAKIHTTFRLGYIKDAVLPRALDDMTMAALHSMMMFNYMDILQSLHALPDYFAQIFRKMRACGRDSEEMELIVTYLQVRTVLCTCKQTQ
jgi:protein phosphatase-4 regulatory subunit 3